MSKWIDTIFEAGQVNRGNIVRRSVHSVDQYASLQELTDEVRRRGFHLARVGEQYVVFCRQTPAIELIC